MGVGDGLDIGGIGHEDHRVTFRGLGEGAEQAGDHGQGGFIPHKPLPRGGEVCLPAARTCQRDFRPGEGQVLSNDGWDGYAPARSRLTQALQKHRVSNPVFLGGDVHANWVGHVKADYSRPDSAAVGVEFCGTSITSRGGSNDGTATVLAENPHFVFTDRERRGYGVAEFTPRQLEVSLRAVDDVTRTDSGISTLARFAVEQGQPKLHSV